MAPGLCRTLYLKRNTHSPCVPRLAQLHAQLTNALSRESNPAPLKYTLSLLGLMSARLRLPLVEPTEATRCAVRAAVAAIDDRCPGYLIGGAGWLADKASFQTAVKPPSTSRSEPVTKLDASLARNTAARAISSGVASRLSRCFGPSAARAAAMSP